MNNSDINYADIKKHFTELELTVIARFLDYTKNQSKNFSAEDLPYETDEEIRENVRNFLADRYAKGHGKRRDQ
jgi:uncharacterized protein (DUF433 family)